MPPQPTEPTTTPWATWLKAALQQAGMTQAALLTALEQSADTPPDATFYSGTISRWVTGRAVPDDPETVVAVARALRARDPLDALDAAGLTNTARLVRAERGAAHLDEMIVAIRTDPVISPEEKADLEAAWQRRQEENRHDFRLRIDAAHARTLRRTPTPTPRHWPGHLRTLLENAGMKAPDLADASDNTLSTRAIEAWLRGQSAPTAMETVLAARILRGDEIQALRAAGYEQDAAVAEAALNRRSSQEHRDAGAHAS